MLEACFDVITVLQRANGNRMNEASKSIGTITCSSRPAELCVDGQRFLNRRGAVLDGWENGNLIL